MFYASFKLEGKDVKQKEVLKGANYFQFYF